MGMEQKTVSVRQAVLLVSALGIIPPMLLGLIMFVFVGHTMSELGSYIGIALVCSLLWSIVVAFLVQNH
jgi:hypothetical protein